MTDNYWKERAEKYNNLDWVNSSGFIGAIIAAGKFSPRHKVLDVGTGTGVIAHAISPLVKQVVAIDSSLDMMDRVNGKFDNVEFKVCDARDLIWHEGTFDRVVARYVFHHILTGTQKAMDECYRVLKPNGVMVFAEGVPPSERTKQDFVRIFKQKEERRTFMPDDMEVMMLLAGFNRVKTRTIWLRRMSVRNWLESSDLDTDRQAQIYAMHVDACQNFKDDYNMVITEDDCLIDMRVAIVSGVKC